MIVTKKSLGLPCIKLNVALISLNTACIIGRYRRRDRSSRPEEFCKKKHVLKYFAKFTGKHLDQNIFFNKVAGLRPVMLLKMRL